MKNTVLGNLREKSPSSGVWSIDILAKRLLNSALNGLSEGRLTINDGDHSASYGDLSKASTLAATVTVTNPRFYGEVAFGGSIGAGEAYMRGYWQVDDLTVLMRILLRNREVLDGMEKGFARGSVASKKLLHWMARNTRGGSRRNIQAHYDLGNDFFELFLDSGMMYSSAIFDRPDMTLEQASEAKLDRICRRLELKPGDRLLEIGTGWGGLAIYAAKHYGCHVTTTTISARQFEYALNRIAEEGLDEQIDLLLCDYRDLSGQFDKLVSIEMIEAVGHAYYDVYFRKCSELLHPEGMMLLQAITIADYRYEAAKASVDFIQRYIFPGSCIPSVGAISASIAGVTDMRLFHLDDIGIDYALTLRCWRTRFFNNIEQVRALGYSDQFIRMWEFYFCYCEGGFLERAISDVHLLMVKPRANPLAVCP